MLKRELQQKLNEIHAQLQALGDLNTLLQQSQNLPTLINDVQIKKASIETFLNDLPTRGEELNRLTTEVKSLNEQLTSRNNEVSDLSEQTKELQKKVGELIEETKVQLGVAANAKLASTFEAVKDELRKERGRWFGWLIRAVIALVTATGLIVWWQVKDAGTLYHLSFPIRLALLSPIIYFVVFVNREYNRVRSLIEEYTFKAAVARSFEAYKEIVQSTDSETNPVRTLEFILESIKGLYSSPMANIKNNALKERENTPDMISGVRSMFDSATRESKT